jgi:diacylglycerol kinase family enzyme
VAWTAIVLNDFSGSGNCTDAAKRVEEMFAAAGRETRITIAKSGPEIRAAAERAVQGGCDAVIAGGGDGTINTAATAVAGTATPLGVLPLGTMNHFAKDLGIPLTLDEAAQVVLDGTVCTVDVGEVNGRIFLNNSSLGVYPTIVRLRERYEAGGLGRWIAALWAGLTVLRRHPFMTVRIVAEGEELIRRTPFVFVGNNEYRMVGLHAGSRESLVKGRVALYVLNAERRIGLLRLAWQVLRKGVDQVQELDLLSVEHATIETRRRRLPVALDGEVIVSATPLVYRTRPQNLQVYVPRQTSACYPVDARPS